MLFQTAFIYVNKLLLILIGCKYLNEYELRWINSVELLVFVSSIN